MHLIGLLSDAGVHSHINHLFSFMKAAQHNGIENIIVHAILDGRDTAPKSASDYLEQLNKFIHNSIGTIGSISGRFYAMDRDNHWDRIERYYRCLTEPQVIQFKDWHSILDKYYNQNITDEFIPPTQLTHKGIIKNGDGIIFFNFRPDRSRELTESFIDPQFHQFLRKQLRLDFFITPVDYGTQHHTKVMFALKPPRQTLKEILSEHHKTIFSIAETEKYAHITYFFNGGIEQQWPHEERSFDSISAFKKL